MPNFNQPVEMYGMLFEPFRTPVSRELYMISRGGSWKKKTGGMAGKGLFYHIRELQKLLWPEKVFTRWSDLLLKAYCENRIIAVMGPASSGKSHESALFALCMYYARPGETTVIVCSTEVESLKNRVWGEIVKYHKMARARFDFLPGEVTNSPLRICTDKRFESVDGRDFRNGFVGVAAKKGQTYQGMSTFVGIKNKVVILLADENSMMPKSHVDAISNLNKNPYFICIASGNPKETTDALGILAEPSAELGGWDAGLDQAPGSKTWKTRFDRGICVQLRGSDCPNMEVPEGTPAPYPFLITREAYEGDVKTYGKDSLQFLMMNEGIMPRGQSLRRVLSRALCHKFNAFDEPIWLNEQRSKIAFMDAAYGSVGGDRCVFGEMQFGVNVEGKTILAIIATMVVPVNALLPELPEDQIAAFVKNQCEERGIPPDRLFFDSTGRGSLVSAFARLWSPTINGVEFGGKPSELPVSYEVQQTCREYYDRRVSELWFNVRNVVEAGQMRGMTEEILLEFAQREWGINPSNSKRFVEPKEKTKLKTGRSPDCADAVVVGVEGARLKGFITRKLSGPNAPGGPSKRMQELQDKAKERAKSYTLNYR